MTAEDQANIRTSVISTNSLIFPEASQNWSRTLSSLKRSTLSITNRLASIHEDSLFVQRVADIYDLPLIANERCGSWYIPPGRKAGSVYFKSTDGHQGQWSFSTRRLNLQVLDVIGRNSGCIIVDSTRRGKSMPDALSKTVPIWCAVINRLAFPEYSAAWELHTPSQVVGTSEHAQIETRLDKFFMNIKAIELDVSSLCSKLSNPLRPIWITQDSSLPSSPLVSEDYLPVVCCTASRRVPGAEASEGGYIQGASDDSEGWSHGLTATVFWQHRQQLMSTAEDALPSLIETLMATDNAMASEKEVVLVKPTKQIYTGTVNTDSDVYPEDFDGVVLCCDHTVESPIGDSNAAKKVLQLRCGAGKLGSRALRAELPRLSDFIHHVSQRIEAPRILFACPTGKDLSAGAALAALCLYFDDAGTFTPQQNSDKVDKLYIRRRLSWIMASQPSSNPSRSTLQAVNSFLMQRP